MSVPPLSNKEFYSLLTGILLGDAHLRSLTKKMATSSLEIKQSYERLPYVKWLHRFLGRLGVNPILPRTDAKGWRFSTKPSLLLGDFRKLFYPVGKKIVPNNVGELILSPIGLAAWYMDDGSLDSRIKDHCNSTFATYGFDLESCQRLVSVLRTNFKVEVSVHSSTMRGKRYWRLYVLSKSMKRFCRVVSPWVLPVFSYKLP